MKIPFSPPDIREEEINEVVKCLKTGWITTGPRTKEFEKQIANYCGTNKAACLNSATACMELTLRLLGVKEGDEVITCAYTYTSTASVVCHVGAKLVLVDTAPDSFLIDYSKLESAITERTKVIIPVDIAGIMCDYDKIFEIVERKKSIFKPSSELQRVFGRIVVMADAAHSFGSVYKGKKSGSVADFTSFSFHAVKNLTTAEGGAVTWKKVKGISDKLIYSTFMKLSLHGQTKDAFEKLKAGSWEYDIISPDYKMNMTDISASLGLAQLARYDEVLKRRHEIINKYNEAFKNYNLQLLPHYVDENNHSNGHLYMVRLLDKDARFRNELIQCLAERGIATNVHFKPLPMLTAYKNLGYKPSLYPNAYKMFKNEITLPLNTVVTDEQIDYIIDNFCDLLNE